MERERFKVILQQYQAQLSPAQSMALAEERREKLAQRKAVRKKRVCEKTPLHSSLVRDHVRKSSIKAAFPSQVPRTFSSQKLLATRRLIYQIINILATAD